MYNLFGIPHNFYGILLKEEQMGYLEIYNKWLSDKRLNDEAKAELESIKGNNEDIEYRFGAELEFGTAGMRGITVRI